MALPSQKRRETQTHAIAIFFPSEGIIHLDRKIISQLSPSLIPICPSTNLKGYGTGSEVDHKNLRRWFFCYTQVTGGRIVGGGIAARVGGVCAERKSQ
jgi:hypothetical protein